MNEVEKRRRGGAAGMGRASALALCMAVAMPAGQAFTAETAGVQLAQAGQSDFDIPSQPLTRALTVFGDQAGLQITVDTAILAGRAAPAVSGRMGAEEALRRLLAGTGIVWRFTDPTTVVLEKASADGAMILDPVTVEGAAVQAAQESAYGPVRGYVAKRTATATKTDASVLETPQSISVVAADEMETRNVQNLEDVVKYTPGIHLSYGATGDSRKGWFNIRGFQTSNYYTDGLSNSVNTGIGWQRTDPYLTERVEILRGPASVMYGQAIPGGMINMVSKRPQENQAAEAAVEYGSFDWKRAEADITGPLDEKKQWLYRVVAVAQDSDGLNGIEHNFNNKTVVAPALTWKPQDGTALTLIAVHSEEESNGYIPRIRYRTAAGETGTTTFLGEPGFDKYDLEQTHLTALAEHRINGNLKLSASARYSNLDLDTQAQWIGEVNAGGTTVARYHWGSQGDMDKSYALDSHAEAKLNLLSTEHTLIGGMDYAYFRNRTQGVWASSTSINIFSPVYGSYTVGTPTTGTDEFRQLGFYAQDQVSIADKWFLLLGGRQDMKGSAHKDAFTSRFGLAYKTDFGLVPYGSYAESFEPQSGTGWGGTTFEPTTGRQYEIGLKYEPPGTNAIATIALFDLVKQNVLTTDPDTTHVCNGGSCSVQTGEVTSRGVELGLTMGLAEGLNAVASYTYNPMEVTKSNVDGEVGRQMYDTPIHLASLWMDYAIQDGPLGGLGFGGGLRFVGKTTNYAGTVSTSPYVQDEYMVRYDVNDWRLSLNVKNLFDREIEYMCDRQTYAEACYLQEPLTVTARVARKF